MSVAVMRSALGELVSGLFRSPLERERAFYRRYRELSGQIEASPNNMTAYALRGELNLERGDHERAIRDFAAAIKLAESADDTKGWLVLEQVMRDRALYGLKLAERELQQPR